MKRLPRRWAVLLLVSVGAFMAFLDAPVVSIAFPAIARTFESSPTATAWVLNAYFLAFAAFLVPAGKLADRYGRRLMFLAGLTLFVAASLAAAAAPSLGVLIAARVLQATAAAILVPSGQALMLAEFPAAERKMAIGALAALVGLATATAPAIGAGIVEVASWRWIFYVNVFVGVAALAWGMRLLRADAPDRKAVLPDFAGAVLQAVAVGFVVLGLLKYHDWGLGNWRTLGSFAIFAGALPLFLWRCARHPAPVLNLDLFRDATVATASAASLLFAVGFYAVTINSVLFLTLVWDYSVLITGLALTPGMLAGVLAAAPAGRMSETHGPRVVAVAGGVLFALGVLMRVWMTEPAPDYVVGWLPGALLSGAGAVMVLTALIGAAVTGVRPERFALASGVNAAIRQLGGALGVAAVVGLVGTPTLATGLDRTHAAFVVAAVAVLAATAVSMLLARPVMNAAPPAAPVPERS
ncbi:MAG: MFS transporter [Actinomycetota bacterium]|nr:MFS transporter [Actinomycetota bacterium]